jgi:trimeric autotransporter adhesin
LNYVAGQTIANAAVVPLGTGGGVTVIAGVSGTDLILDTNGYYGPAGVGIHNTFLGLNAGNFTMTGDNNTGLGHNALFSNSTGDFNTAAGAITLSNNTTGCCNTAIGYGALVANTMAGGNTAAGYGALFTNTTGVNNTATGDGALNHNNGTANTASGAFALSSNTTGGSNTAAGDGALQFITMGNLNIAVGTGAGSHYLTTESNDICIGNTGVVGESGTIRIGSAQTKTFIAGVNGVMTGGTGTPVLIDANGQLGTISSSARFKDEIQDMGEATDGLLKLRPVTFRYKAQPEGQRQFGLIAEEVEKVMPELVVCSSSGEAETVLYHEMPAMLLNELQKQQRQIQELKSELSALRAVIGEK